MNENAKCLVVFSGGQDSTTCLYHMRMFCKPENIHAITFNYGQRHAAEIEAAKRIAEMAGVGSHRVVDIGPVLVGSSPLVSDAQLEQYASMHALPGGLEKTFVPGRNALFLVLAANHAHSLGITKIVTGVCEEDYGGYPDCRQSFIQQMERALVEGFAYDENDAFCSLEIYTPLMHLSKAATVCMAQGLPGCMEALAYSHTSYDGAYPPTGNDHATLLRAKGFLEAGVPDPLVMRANDEGLMSLPLTSNYDSVRG